MKYNKKIPVGKFPHCHYSKGRKSKKAFESLKSAEKYISGLHLSGYTPYICPVCCNGILVTTMAKPKTPNQKRKYSELNSRLAKYVALIEEIYEQLNLEAAKLVSTHTDYNAEDERPFRWSDYPQTRQKIADIQKRFVEDIQAVIYRGTSEEWKTATLCRTC